MSADDVDELDDLDPVREMRLARFSIGDVVRHRIHAFRGVIYDVDPTFSNTEEWYQSIPANVRPARDQPYYHLLAESDESTYEAYVSEQNLLHDETGAPCRHPLVPQLFFELPDGGYSPREITSH
jgi:heat shock protein HspQ